MEAAPRYMDTAINGPALCPPATQLVAQADPVSSGYFGFVLS